MPPDNRKPGQQGSVGSANGARGSSGNSGARGEGSLGEVYFEFRPIGTYMRVNAIHAASGRETFVLGPLNASRSDLQLLALRKLKNILGSSNQ